MTGESYGRKTRNVSEQVMVLGINSELQKAGT